MYLTIKDLSQRLNVPQSTLYAWAAEGILPVRKMGGLLRFHPEEIARWEETCKRERQEPSPTSRAAGKRDDVDVLIARVKREVYTPRHGETRPRSSPNRKEEGNGAL